MSKRSCICSCIASALVLTLAVATILDFGLPSQAVADDRARAVGASLLSDAPEVGIAADYALAGCDGRGTRLQALVEPGSAVEPLTYRWSGPGLAGLAGPEAVVADSLAPGTHTYSLVVTGSNGAVSEAATHTLTVLPAIDCSITGPDVVCPSSVTTYCGPPGGSSYAWTTTGGGTIVGSSTDMCAEVRASSRCATQFKLTLRVGSGTGCPSICSMDITVFDITPPVITCPVDVTLDCAASTDPGITGTPTVTDACDTMPELTYSDVAAPGTCPVLLTITRTWRAADDCGNSATCVQTIRLVDDTPPDLVCPPEVTVECDESTDPSHTGRASATDACGEVLEVTYSDHVTPGRCPEAFLIDRAWSAVDDCGNTGTCHQMIAVVDTTPPQMTCPGPRRLQCRSELPPPDPGDLSASDNCDPLIEVAHVGDVSDGLTCPETVTRTWRATDDCGNWAECAQTFIISDTIPPVIVCPRDTTIACGDPTDPANTGQATASDNCDDQVSVTYDDQVTVTTDPCGILIARTWKATDECNNQATCVQWIVCVDTSGPQFRSTPADHITVNCGEVPDPPNLDAFDQCDDDVQVQYSELGEPGECEGESTLTRTWTAWDNCGHSAQFVQTVDVVDTLAPYFTTPCPADLTVECSEVPSPVAMAAEDACTGTVPVGFIEQRVDGSCPGGYALMRTWTAQDDCGNTVRCAQTVTVRDEAPPEIVCPPDREFGCDQQPEFGEATATDSCDPDPTITYEDEVVPGGSPQEYVVERTWAATDDCGNLAQCIQRVSVVDETGPVLIRAPDERLLCNQPVVFTDPQIDDYCDPEPTLSVKSNTITPGPGECEYTYTRCWQAEDAAGNLSATVCQNIIRYEDTEAPVLTCAPDKVILPGEPVVFDDPAVTDNCPVGGPDYPNMTFTQSSSVVAGETTYTRCWIAYDICGNESNECCQNITVGDEPNPDPYCSFVCWNWTAACLRDPYNHEISTPPACLRDEHFYDVFPQAVTIGSHDSPGLFMAAWTSPGAVERFKCGYGLPEPLHADWVDPRNTDLGALQAEILTLRLNREFSCAGYFEAYGYPMGEGCFGELIVPVEGLRFAGLTVDQFLAIADRAVAGDKSALLPYGYSYYKLHATAAYLNWLYGECNGYGSLDGSGPVVLGGTDGDAGWEDEVQAVPAEFSMAGSPNPMRSSVTITLALPAAGDVSLEVYDVQGRVVTTLMSGERPAGYHSVTWDGADHSGARVSSGVYFCRVQLDGRFVAMEKLMKL